MLRKQTLGEGCALLGVALLACLPGSAPSAVAAEERGTLDGVMAHVNEHVITVGDVLAAIQPVIPQLREASTGDEFRNQLRDTYARAVTNLVNHYLILDAYEGQEMRIQEWMVDRRVETMVRTRFNGDHDALLKALAEEGLAYETWRDRIRERMATAAMRELVVESKASIAPARVRAEYEKNLDRYRVPAQVHLRMIVLKKESAAGVAAKRAFAAELRRDLVAGQDFAGLASEHSQGIHAAQGGDWGWLVPKKTLRRELAEAVASIKAGETSDVIETADEFYILRVEARKDASLKPFHDVQPQIERELKQSLRERLYTAWIRRLQNDAYVKIFDVDPF